MNAKAISTDLTPDSKLADSHHAAERATILQAIETADDLKSTALLSALRMTATLGSTSKDEVAASWPSCNNPGVYASWFNVAAKAAEVVGEKLVMQTIDQAAAAKGQSFQNAREALQAIIKEAKSQGVKQLKPAAAKMAAKAAVAKVQAPKAPTLDKVAPRGPKMQDAATLAAAAIEAGKGHRELAAFVTLAAQHASRLPAPEGREDLHSKAVRALQDAAEMWAGFRK